MGHENEIRLEWKTRSPGAELKKTLKRRSGIHPPTPLETPARESDFFPTRFPILDFDGAAVKIRRSLVRILQDS